MPFSGSGGGVLISVECVTLDELADEVNRHTQWQWQFSRPINDDDMRVASAVDLTDIEAVIRELDSIGAVSVGWVRTVTTARILVMARVEPRDAASEELIRAFCKSPA